MVGGSRSSCHPVLSGVPQGSVLGPLLFIVFVNHLVAGISLSCKIFADDHKLYFSLRNIGSGDSVGQRDIDHIYNTALSCGLKLNVSKCVILRFGASSSQSGHPSYTIGTNLLPFIDYPQAL